MSKDLRLFLETLHTQAPELLARVPRQVSPRWELSAVQRRFEVDGRLPVIVFEDVAGASLPVVTNLFASKRHLAIGLETSPENVVARFAAAQEGGLPTRGVTTGPVKEVVVTQGEANLGTLPLVTHCEKDGGPYITAGVTIMRDPGSGALNTGIYRHLALSPTSLTVNMAPLCHPLANAHHCRGRWVWLGARGESPASHRDRRGARPARREEGEYREYLTHRGQRSAPPLGGCIGGRMQRDFHHGLLRHGRALLQFFEPVFDNL